MIGGPLGALFGAAFGHNFDVGVKAAGSQAGGRGWGRQEQVQTAFFTATFSIMGNLCKADGRVTEDEISLARHIMQQMALSAEQKKVAMRLFNEGKKPGFPVDDVLRQLKHEIGYQPNLQRMFLEIQLYAACADGVLHDAEKQLLRRVGRVFGVSSHDLDQLAAAILGEIHHRHSARGGKPAPISMDDAYAVLGLTRSASDAEVKKAYRRLMSQHHPDKLVSRGLPEEMIKVAEQRTHEVRQAYERIKEERGF